MDNETRFRTALQFVLKWEGGDWHPAPGDPNPTSRGITQRFYDAVARKYGWPAARVYDLTDDMVADCYRLIWQQCRAGEMPELVGMAHFDCSVNISAPRTTRFLQRAVNVYPDGLIGPRTVAATWTAGDPRHIVVRMTGQRVRFYKDQAARHPDMAKFLRGWLNRVTDLQRALKVG